jgi:hypothetical protein
MVLLEKIRMAPCRASVSLPFPKAHAGSCFVGRRAVPSAGETDEQRNGAARDSIGVEAGKGSGGRILRCPAAGFDETPPGVNRRPADQA